jgi:hypothetical protein
MITHNGPTYQTINFTRRDKRGTTESFTLLRQADEKLDHFLERVKVLLLHVTGNPTEEIEHE